MTVLHQWPSRAAAAPAWHHAHLPRRPTVYCIGPSAAPKGRAVGGRSCVRCAVA